MKADRKRVEPLIKTARGQLDAVLKMIDDDRYCIDIANQLMAAEALLHKAQHEVIKGHMLGCVQEAFSCGDETEQERKIDEIIKFLDKVEK